MNEKAYSLLNILFDKSAMDHERDDVAMDLGYYPDKDVLNALIQIASDPNEDDLILDSCGDSIARILIGLNEFDKSIFEKITPTAKNAAYLHFQVEKPSWMKDIDL